MASSFIFERREPSMEVTEMDSNIGKRGRGRPKEEYTRDHDIRIRLDDREKYMLDSIIEATGDNTSDVLRIALHGYFVHLREVGKID